MVKLHGRFSIVFALVMFVIPSANSKERAIILIAVSCFLGLSFVHASDFQGATHLMPFDEETINYSKGRDSSPVARLQERIERGETKLRHDDRFGYLLALLEELRVPTNSQMLVFSKTSFQRERISPKTPRSIYFNDEVYLGFVQGSPML